MATLLGEERHSDYPQLEVCTRYTCQHPMSEHAIHMVEREADDIFLHHHTVT